LVQAGVGLLSALLIGLTIGVRIPTPWGTLDFNWSTSGGTAETISGAIAVTAIILVGVGLALIIRDARREGRKRVIVIEARGLRDWQGTPLDQAVPSSILGSREQVIVDVRQGLVDGKIVDPSAVLRRVTSLPDDLARRSDGLDRRDITYVVGGLAPVPLLFLIGIIVDDESQTNFMDWDRHTGTWRQLDASDDGKRFIIAGLDQVAAETPRVALCVSASYDVLDSDVAVAEPGIPIVRMDLDGRSTSANWSETKQRELGRQFLEVARTLASKGVKEITLFLAAPASLALRFGAVYDKRNLPLLEVNQYERGDPKVFPWAIRMPVSGRQNAEVFTR